jgi:hypothetical protein
MIELTPIRTLVGTMPVSYCDGRWQTCTIRCRALLHTANYDLSYAESDA